MAQAYPDSTSLERALENAEPGMPIDVRVSEDAPMDAAAGAEWGRDTGLAMVFKLLQAAEGRWRAVNGPHLVALVRAGARFQAGKLVERCDQDEVAA
jgi:hypothetical protein